MAEQRQGHLLRKHPLPRYLIRFPARPLMVILILQPSYVNNLDLRWEHFGENAQMFALSVILQEF